MSPSRTKKKKRIHETNHEFFYVAEFDSNERPSADGYEPNEHIKKRIHETNHEFSYVAEFDSNERPSADGYEPNEQI